MRCISTFESANCHIKSRDLENLYWISKYLGTI